ncbi:CPBP family intramembrane metalloprotease [Burkholderiaceae bacterium DAT-1]|nr:CPBP family intramembrane metalloprotease [Burkholderiaceae bacterium DAT-1]
MSQAGFLPFMLADIRAGLRYALMGAKYARMVLLVSLMAIFAVSLLYSDLPRSQAHELASTNSAAIFAVGVLLIPFVETFMGQSLPIEIGRRVTKGHRNLMIILSALFFGAGHTLTDGMAHGITTFFIGVILAHAYSSMRDEGIVASVSVTFIAHALNNVALFFVVMPLFGNV